MHKIIYLPRILPRGSKVVFIKRHSRPEEVAAMVAGLAGLGLVQGMNVFLQPYLDRGLLVEVLPDNPTPDRKLSLLYPHRHLSRKVRGFTEWLESLL